MSYVSWMDFRIRAYNTLINAGFKVELDDRLYGYKHRDSGRRFSR